MADNNPNTTTDPPDDSAFAAALPFTLTTNPTTTQSIVIRRLTSVGTAAALLYLLRIPQPSTLLTNIPPFASYPLAANIIDSLFSNLLILNTLIFSYHLALRTSPVTINNKTIPTQWLMPGASAVVALAAGAEDTWVKTNLLWNIVGVFWVCGWTVMTTGQREWMKRWIWRAIIGTVIEKVSREYWGKEGWEIYSR